MHGGDVHRPGMEMVRTHTTTDDPRTAHGNDTDTDTGLIGADPLVDKALELGGTLESFLASVTGAYLTPQDQARFRRTVKLAAAHGACAGLSLWAVAKLARSGERYERLGSALAGVSFALMKDRPMGPGVN